MKVLFIDQIAKVNYKYSFSLAITTFLGCEVIERLSVASSNNPGFLIHVICLILGSYKELLQ